MEKYLVATEMLDANHPSVVEYVAEFKKVESDKDKAIALYNKVRDGFVYTPYHLDLRPQGLTASTILQKKKAWCVEKAIVLATGLRALGIPSRLGYGIVVNHIGVEKLLHYLRRPEIVFHGFVDVYVEGKWVKATPAFDPLVCRKAGVPILDWDGENDAMFQAYLGSQEFMEYKHYYGVFDDVPVQLMNEEMKKYYPHLFESVFNTPEFSLLHIWS